MTKVCHMTSVHQPEDVRIFHKECVSLAKAGFDVFLVERGDSYEKDGVHLVGVGEISRNRLRRMTKGASDVYEAALRVDADIYHFHDPELLPYGLKLKQSGKKVIFDSHEDTLESILEKNWLPKPVRQAAYQWFDKKQRRICRELDAVITVTPHLTEFFRSFAPRVEQITNYPAVGSAYISPAYENHAISFAGGIDSQWNHGNIIRAMERLPDCRYYMCGPAGEEYLAGLKALPAWERVEFPGKIPHDTVGTFIAKGSIGMALLSYCRNSDGKNGTMGNTKIFEEMMAGLPVICTDFVRWREFVERWHCGICVDPSNVDEIADAIQYLFDHPDEARQMGENGRRAVEEEFNWAHEEKKLLALYEDILNEK